MLRKIAVLLIAMAAPASAQFPTCSGSPLWGCIFDGTTTFLPRSSTTINSASLGVKGAKCDGKTDDLPAFQAAVTAAGVNGGSVLVPVTASGCFLNGTLHLAASNVTLAGQSARANLIFPGGTSDDIDVGDGTTTYAHVWLKNLQITHTAAKTGGTAAQLLDLYESGVENVEIDGFFNGMLVQQTNNIVVRDSVLTAPSSGGSYGVKWYSPADNAHRSDVLALEDVVINMGFQGGDGLVWDGMTQTLRLHHVGIINTHNGMLVQNTAQSNTFYPAFLQADDLEIDGVSAEGLRIEAGVEMSLVNSDIDCAVSSCLRALHILPDLAGSVTRGISIANTRFHITPHEAALIEAKSVYITTTRFSDTNQAAGVGQVGSWPALELGANASQVVIDDSCACARFGDFAFPKWGVQVDAGANAVSLTGNDYRNAPSGAVNNLAGDGNVFLVGGINGDGSQVGPQVVDGGINGTKFVSLVNGGTASSTQAGVQLSTGRANAFASITQQDGATPALTIATGPGDTGGINLSTQAPGAPITLGTLGGGPVLAPGTYILGSHPPASSSTACSFGTITWAAGFLYVCVATNTWQRGTLAAF